MRRCRAQGGMGERTVFIGPAAHTKPILRASLAFLLDAGEALRNLRSRGAGGTRQVVGGAVVAWATGITGMLGSSGVRVAQE